MIFNGQEIAHGGRVSLFGHKDCWIDCRMAPDTPWNLGNMFLSLSNNETDGVLDGRRVGKSVNCHNIASQHDKMSVFRGWHFVCRYMCRWVFEASRKNQPVFL